jgi:formate hydrogenlyase subunit 3/multisubunit Na+/H+ antiporter MnhD subunit
VFLMIGTFALLGFPPFGSFFGELLILSALVGSGQDGHVRRCFVC